MLKAIIIATGIDIHHTLTLADMSHDDK